MKNFWLVKTEPSTYSWEDLGAEKETSWTGVRNFSARNNLRAMKKGDNVLFYYSGADKAVVGLCEVTREAYPDKTAKEGDWSTVDLKPKRRLKNAVSLATVKATPTLKEMKLVRLSRLSVTPVTAAEFKTVLKLAGE